MAKRFRINAKSIGKLWEIIESENGNSKLTQYKLTEFGRRYLFSKGLRNTDLLKYPDFQDLAREYSLIKNQHYVI